MEILKRFLLKKEDGDIAATLPHLVFLILAALLLSSYIITLNVIDYSAGFIKDGVTLSNLGGLIVDVDKYYLTGYTGGTLVSGNSGVTNTIPGFTEGELALKLDASGKPSVPFEKFCQCLKTNLKLDDNFNSINENILDDFNLESYIVYNVVYATDSNGNIDKSRKMLNTYIYDQQGFVRSSTQAFTNDLYTPNGVKIVNSCTYCKITFTLMGMKHEKIPSKWENTVSVRQN